MSTSFTQMLWDIWCIASIIGIWPRYIEPSLILTTKLSLSLPSLPSDLDGLKILQLSDLHLNDKMSDRYLARVNKHIALFAPDLIVLTGDFLCHAQLQDKQRLQEYLKSIPKAPYGSYAILGNHDYAQCVSINSKGDYDIAKPPESLIKKGFEILFSNVELSKHITEEARAIGFHQDLLKIIQDSSLTLLHNETVVIPIKNSFLNITGLGEYVLGKLQPEEAFKKYDNRYPGIILAHNPDSAAHLQSFPGNIILSGHTHGGQVNLPWMWKRFTRMEDMQLKKGLFHKYGKWIYVNRGIGSIFKFRWFSPPELLFLTLKKNNA